MPVIPALGVGEWRLESQKLKVILYYRASLKLA